MDAPLWMLSVLVGLRCEMINFLHLLPRSLTSSQQPVHSSFFSWWVHQWLSIGLCSSRLLSRFFPDILIISLLHVYYYYYWFLKITIPEKPGCWSLLESWSTLRYLRFSWWRTIYTPKGEVYLDVNGKKIGMWTTSLSLPPPQQFAAVFLRHYFCAGRVKPRHTAGDEISIYTWRISKHFIQFWVLWLILQYSFFNAFLEIKQIVQSYNRILSCTI